MLRTGLPALFLGLVGLFDLTVKHFEVIYFNDLIEPVDPLLF
jgi:hypothetical protein